MSGPVTGPSQNAVELDLSWHEGDPISLAWSVEADDGTTPIDWGGVYAVQVRKAQSKTSPLLGTLSLHGNFVGIVTEFALVATVLESVGIPAGVWYYDAQQENGPTRFRGRVTVTAEVTG